VVYFSNPDVCLAEMVKFRWPDGVVKCPNCGGTKVAFIKSRRVWECAEKHAKRQFSVKVGTIMEDSAIGLDKWLIAMWLIANARNGISSYELARAIGVTQKTGWFMLHRIRLAMQAEDGGKMYGEVEVDETYIGGKARNMHKSRRARFRGKTWFGKVAVMGLLERHAENPSQVRARVVDGTKRRHLVNQMKENIEVGSQVFPDTLPTYSSMGHLFVHKFIDHAEAYARSNVHTNGLENFWSLLKRALRGTYVSVEPFHLFRYLDEQCFRFNNQKLSALRDSR
jgi:transposase-like protein